MASGASNNLIYLKTFWNIMRPDVKFSESRVAAESTEQDVKIRLQLEVV